MSNTELFPGIQPLHLQHVALDRRNPAAGEADEVGAHRRPGGEDPGEGVGGVAPWVHLEGGPLVGAVIS